MKFNVCQSDSYSTPLIDQKDNLSLTEERRAILESVPIMPTVLTSTDYQHARNATKISLPKFLPVLTFQNLATATNVSAGILIQTTPFNEVARSQRTTLWDQMK